MSDMKIDNVVYEIKALIEDTIMTENEGSRRCLNNEDLNKFESWIKILEQANGANSKPANCAIFDVNNLAKLAEFVKQQKDLPPEINDIVNDNFWDLI